MLKKQNRITKNKEFEVVMKQKKAVYCPVLMIKYVKNDFAFSRFGIIVSNKISKKAYQRNLIKRRIREIIRINFAKIKKGNDLVIIVSPKIINKEAKIMSHDEMEEVLLNTLKKANLV